MSNIKEKLPNIKEKLNYRTHDAFFQHWAVENKAAAAAAAKAAAKVQVRVSRRRKEEEATPSKTSLLALVSAAEGIGQPVVCGLVTVDTDELITVIEGESAKVKM